MMGFSDLKIRRDRLYEQVAQGIEEMINYGKLKAGDQLLPEREMAASLNVSRTVVREAVKTLVERGLVSIQPGQGIFVAAPNTNLLSGQLERFFRLNARFLEDLLVVRRILEVEIAGLAPQKATAQDLKEMQEAIERMDKQLESAEGFVKADQDFHAALARATRNEILPLLLEALVDRLQESRRMIFRVKGAPQRGQTFHRAIYEAVKNGDVRGAQEAMRQHLRQVEEDSKAGQKLAELDGH